MRAEAIGAAPASFGSASGEPQPRQQRRSFSPRARSIEAAAAARRLVGVAPEQPRLTEMEPLVVDTRQPPWAVWQVLTRAQPASIWNTEHLRLKAIRYQGKDVTHEPWTRLREGTELVYDFIPFPKVSKVKLDFGLRVTALEPGKSITFEYSRGMISGKQQLQLQRVADRDGDHTHLVHRTWIQEGSLIRAGYARGHKDALGSVYRRVQAMLTARPAGPRRRP